MISHSVTHTLFNWVSYKMKLGVLYFQTSVQEHIFRWKLGTGLFGCRKCWNQFSVMSLLIDDFSRRRCRENRPFIYRPFALRWKNSEKSCVILKNSSFHNKKEIFARKIGTIGRLFGRINRRISQGRDIREWPQVLSTFQGHHSPHGTNVHRGVCHQSLQNQLQSHLVTRQP